MSAPHREGLGPYQTCAIANRAGQDTVATGNLARHHESGTAGTVQGRFRDNGVDDWRLLPCLHSDLWQMEQPPMTTTQFPLLSPPTLDHLARVHRQYWYRPKSHHYRDILSALIQVLVATQRLLL
jgi:hypothetical protein